MSKKYRLWVLQNGGPNEWAIAPMDEDPAETGVYVFEDLDEEMAKDIIECGKVTPHWQDLVERHRHIFANTTEGAWLSDPNAKQD